MNTFIREFLLETHLQQLRTLVRHQDVSGLWHTLIDDPKSYLEASATAGFAYGILKSVRKGYIGREYAHDLVYDICREAVKQQRPLLDLLAEHPEIKRHLDRAALAKLCDPANYLGQSGVMVDRVLATLR